jgi:hypothetical protein
LTLAAILLLGCGTDSGHSSAEAATAVITRVADAKIPYPTARLSGRLSLRDGCLMIGDGVVFWPAETSWNDAKREVAFGGDFHGSPNSRLLLVSAANSRSVRRLSEPVGLTVCVVTKGGPT